MGNNLAVRSGVRRAIVVVLAVVGVVASSGVRSVVAEPAPRVGEGRAVVSIRSEVPSAEPRRQNPFDPDEIDVRAEFVAPDGEVRRGARLLVPGYKRSLVDGREQLTATGRPHFEVRFTPDAPGRWRWRWAVRAGGDRPRCTHGTSCR